NDQNVSDTRQHERSERIIDHRFVVNGEQAFADRVGDRIQPRSRPARQNDAPICVVCAHSKTATHPVDWAIAHCELCQRYAVSTICSSSLSLPAKTLVARLGSATKAGGSPGLLGAIMFGTLPPVTFSALVII